MVDHRRTSDVATLEKPVETNGKQREHEEEPPIKEIRATDIEPYTGLRYLSKLFRFMAIIVILLIAAEVITGISAQGASSIPTLLGEASRLIVLAGVLWGTGDLAHLLIDVGHDVRAARILLARQTYHLTQRMAPDRAVATGLDRLAMPADRSTGGQAPPIP
jgi:hypothetical protein